MIAFYCVFALVIILFGVKSFIGYRSIKPNPYDPYSKIYGKTIDLTTPYEESLRLLASDATPFWQYHESNGKSRRKRCNKALLSFKAKFKRKKKA